MFKIPTDQEAIFSRIDAEMNELVEAMPADFTPEDIEKFNETLRRKLEAENLSLEDYHDCIASKLIDDTE
jgi:hypothetical protein